MNNKMNITNFTIEEFMLFFVVPSRSYQYYLIEKYVYKEYCFSTGGECVINQMKYEIIQKYSAYNYCMNTEMFQQIIQHYFW